MSTDNRKLLPFDSIVDQVATQLRDLYVDQSGEVVDRLIDVAGSKKGRARVLRSMDGLSTMFQNTYTESDASRRILPMLRKAMVMGAGNGGNEDSITRSADAMQVLEGFEESVRFYADNYVKRVVSPRVSKAAENARDDQVDVKVANALQHSFDDSLSYWKAVANNAVSRAYHYGVMKASVDLGFTQIMFMAVLDEATTPFCHKIDGLTIKVKPAILKMEEVSQLRGSKVHKYAPWKLIKGVKRVNEKILKSNGLLFPPFHAHCRTTIMTF